MKRISGPYYFITSQIRLTALFVNTGHVKMKGIGKLFSFEHIPDNTSSCYIFLSLSEGVVYFHETD